VEDSVDDLAKLEVELQKVTRRYGKAKAKLIFAEKAVESLPS